MNYGLTRLAVVLLFTTVGAAEAASAQVLAAPAVVRPVVVQSRPTPRNLAADINGDGRYDPAVGASTGPAHVKVFSGASGALLKSFMAFPTAFAGGVRVAVGDVNGDGRADVIVGAGPGAAGHVKVFDGVTGAEIRSFLAFGAGFAGGVHVAAGDINGDGKADVVVGAGAGAAPHVKVFDGATGQLLSSYFAYPNAAAVGVQVAAGDVNGDGRADIITAPASGAAAHVKVFDGVTGQVVSSFMAYPSVSAGSVWVASGDVNGDGRADVVTATASGAAGHVKVFDGKTGQVMASFMASGAGPIGALAAGDVNGDGRADLLVTTGAGSQRQTRVFDGQSNALISTISG